MQPENHPLDGLSWFFPNYVISDILTIDKIVNNIVNIIFSFFIINGLFKEFGNHINTAIRKAKIIIITLNIINPPYWGPIQ